MSRVFTPSVFRGIASLWVFLMIASSAFAQATEQHVVEAKGWQSKAVTPTEINRRIEEAAAKYSEYAPIPRIAFYDIAYPKGASEYADLDGNAVLVITVLSQEPAELPLTRVFVSSGGNEIELKRITLVLSKEVGAEGKSLKTFGAYRADAIYLIPVYLCLKNDLFADFAKNRTGFKIAEFPSDVPSEVRELPIKPPAGAGPSVQALVRLLRREYPGFLK
jgi:hypothetical protein